MVSTWRQASIIGRPVGLASGSRRPPAAVTAVLLLTLAALGCSTSPDDERSPAIEEPSRTTEAVLPTTTVQPDSPSTTAQPDQPEPPPTTEAEQADPATTAQAEQTSPTPTTTEAEQAEKPTSQSDQTSPSGTVTDGATSGLGADSASSQSYENILRSVDPGVAPALLPWGDGFLEYGYRATGEHQWDHTRLLFRLSADGRSWSDFETLQVPFEDVLASDTSGHPIAAVATDGQRLLFVVQHGDRILVSITSDLSDWDTIEIVPPQPDGLPYGVRAEPIAEQLAIGPDGWLLYTSIHLGVDAREIAPADIRESAQYIGLGDPDYVGGEFVYGESRGLEIWWKTKQQEPDEPGQTRFVTWEELGIDEDTYRHYGIAHYANKPYTPNWFISGEVWSADWGQEPVRAALPEVRAAWWTVVGTDAGYVGLPRLGQLGYAPYGVVEYPMFFSRDGLAWAAIDAPEGDREGDRLLPSQISAVENGVLVIGDVVPDGQDRFPVGSRLWLGDATGSDWQAVALPGLPEQSWIALRAGGHGAAGMGGPTEGDWSAQRIVGSKDGVDWLVVEDSTAGDLRTMAINGDVMVGIDGQGNSRRFLVP